MLIVELQVAAGSSSHVKHEVLLQLYAKPSSNRQRLPVEP